VFMIHFYVKFISVFIALRLHLQTFNSIGYDKKQAKQ
jgi:hypothetical protein